MLTRLVNKVKLLLEIKVNGMYENVLKYYPLKEVYVHKTGDGFVS